MEYTSIVSDHIIPEYVYVVLSGEIVEPTVVHEVLSWRLDNVKIFNNQEL